MINCLFLVQVQTNKSRSRLNDDELSVSYRTLSGEYLFTDQNENRILELLDITLFADQFDNAKIKSMDELDEFYDPNFNVTFLFNGYSTGFQEVEWLDVGIIYLVYLGILLLIYRSDLFNK